MNVLVTGASGMLGTDLVPELAKKFNLFTTGRGPSNLPNYTQADLSNSSEVLNLLEKTRPDVVLHTAAMTDVDACETRREEAVKANVETVKNLVAAAKKTSALLVHFSTDYVFSGDQPGELPEEAPRGPVSFYGETKRLAEEYIEKNSTNYVIIRVAWLYAIHGPRCFPRVILDRAKTQTEFKVVSNQFGRPTYTRDLAAGLTKMLESGVLQFEKCRNTIYHLANSGSASRAEFAEAILRGAGYTGTVVKKVDANEFKAVARRPLNSVLKLEKAKKMLGLELRPWQEAILDFIKEYKKQEQAA